MKKISASITIILFFSVILFFALGTMFKEKQSFNEVENRWLTQKAENLTLENYLDKSYSKGYENYLNDHLIFRTNLVQTKYNLERMQGKTVINDVIKLENQLVQRFYVDDYKITDENIDSLIKFANKYPKCNITTMIAPTVQSVFETQIPTPIKTTSQKNYINYCYERLEMQNITNVNVLSAISEARNDYIYYRTDHHWTSYGAYLGYVSLGNKMNFTPLSMSNFSIEYASNSFKGSLYSLTLDETITDDVVKFYYRNGRQPNIVMNVFDGYQNFEYNNLYFREFLDKKDKHLSYLGGNFPIINIKSDVETERTLLVIKDSYANSLIPFLANNYSEISIIDPRFLNGGIEKLTNPEEFTDIIYIGNVMSFATESSLKGLV